jgi:hypothetical protein
MRQGREIFFNRGRICVKNVNSSAEWRIFAYTSHVMMRVSMLGWVMLAAAFLQVYAVAAQDVSQGTAARTRSGSTHLTQKSGFFDRHPSLQRGVS